MSELLPKQIEKSFMDCAKFLSSQKLTDGTPIDNKIRTSIIKDWLKLCFPNEKEFKEFLNNLTAKTSSNSSNTTSANKPKPQNTKSNNGMVPISSLKTGDLFTVVYMGEEIYALYLYGFKQGNVFNASFIVRAVLKNSKVWNKEKEPFKGYLENIIGDFSVQTYPKNTVIPRVFRVLGNKSSSSKINLPKLNTKDVKAMFNLIRAETDAYLKENTQIGKLSTKIKRKLHEIT